MDKSMILTDEEYECTIGIPPRDDDRKIIFACINNLSNSNGNTNIPLSSYGLAITNADQSSDPPPSGDVQSLCAPEAPCLVFNALFDGPLERIATSCGWLDKLTHMLRQTQFVKFAAEGALCQKFAGSQRRWPVHRRTRPSLTIGPAAVFRTHAGERARPTSLSSSASARPFS